jgi:hypothetical protein
MKGHSCNDGWRSFLLGLPDLGRADSRSEEGERAWKYSSGTRSSSIRSGEDTANSSSQRLGGDRWRSSTRIAASVALHADLRSDQGPPRRVGPGVGHRGGARCAGRSVPSAAGTGRQLAAASLATLMEVRAPWPIGWTTALVRDRIERGVAWEPSRGGGARLARDRWVQRPYPPFTGGTAVGQWRHTPPGFRAMTAGIGIHRHVRLADNTQFRLSRRAAGSATLRTISTPSRRSVKTLSTRTGDQTALAPLGGQRRRLESGSEPGPRQSPVHLRQQPASRGSDIAMARRTGVHHPAAARSTARP